MKPAWINTVKEALDQNFGQQTWICAFATVDDHGRPHVRTMVCRAVESDGRLIFASDRHHNIDDHLRESPACEICFWLPKAAMQIRVKGEATVFDSDNDMFTCQTWWDKLPDENRAIFLAGAHLSSQHINNVPPTFVVIAVYPSSVETLDIRKVPYTKTELLTK